MTPPHPGSPEARGMGCVCPAHANHDGAGVRGNGARYGWYVDALCDVHRIPPLDAPVAIFSHKPRVRDA